MESLKSFSSYVNLCTKVGHNFGCHMTPAEFYVSSDALVHLRISTEYLSKSCRTVGWMPCPKGSATARLGVRDFEIHWISRGFQISNWISVFHMDFWISKWISGFQSGFQDFKVDFWISKWISDFKVDFCIIFKVDLDFWAGHMAYKYMHEQICMHDILYMSPQKMTFVPDRKSVRYKGHCCVVM